MKKSFAISRIVLIVLILHTGTILHLNSSRPIQETGTIQDYSREILNTAGLVTNVDFGQIPLYFIPNRGQVHSKALFYAKTQNYTLWLTKDGLIFDRTMRKRDTDQETHARYTHTLGKMRFKRDVSYLRFVGSHTKTEVAPIKTCEYRVNYLVGKNPGNWFKNIPTSQSVLYKNLYDHIDLKVYGNGTQLEYDWIVRPGGNPEEIKFEFSNTKSCAQDQEGNLSVITEAQKIVHKKPHAYQMIGAEKKEIAVSFLEITENRFGLSIGNYDPICSLVIDPFVLVYSTFLGGEESEYGFAIAVDETGAFYVAGYTFSQYFPKTQSTNEDIYVRIYSDAFITKLNPSGSALEYSTYLGGEYADYAYGIAVDNNGCAYVTGETWSPKSFPTTPGSYDTMSWRKGDVFVTKIAPDGSHLVYSTFLDGSRSDIGYAIAVDNFGSAYVTGGTKSLEFPATTVFRGSDTFSNAFRVFVTKLNPQGNRIEYSVICGAAGPDLGHAITIDGSGNAYVTGRTKSPAFPTTPDAWDSKINRRDDALLMLLNPYGNELLYSTFIGGGASETGNGIAIDNEDSVYIVGSTLSEDFPTNNAYDGVFNGNGDVFVMKFANDTASPVVTITAPADGETVTRDVLVKATASDDRWIEKVVFYIDENVTITKSKAPYSFVWKTQEYKDGLHQILARAFDLAGNNSDDAINVSVHNTKKIPRHR